MNTQRSDLKFNAIGLRKRGLSLPKISSRLRVPKSTLYGWLKDVPLSVEHREIIARSKLQALVKARAKAVIWHQQQKLARLRVAGELADHVITKLHISPALVELAMAMLYLGEGRKNIDYCSLGSSDPEILKFYLNGLLSIFHIPKNSIKCELHLRLDQNEDEMLLYWSKELQLHKSQFTSIVKDKRTIGKLTYPHYRGVCVINGGGAATQRRLLSLSRKFCSLTIHSRVYSSAG